MNLYATLGSGIATVDASNLTSRLTAWHDAMVAHERRLLSGSSEGCDDECPHVEARSLWAEAVAIFGPDAHNLTFLRSRALGDGIRSVRENGNGSAGVTVAEGGTS